MTASTIKRAYANVKYAAGNNKRMGGVTVTPPILLLFYVYKHDGGLRIGDIGFIADVRYKTETAIVRITGDDPGVGVIGINDTHLAWGQDAITLAHAIIVQPEQFKLYIAVVFHLERNRLDIA